MVTMVWEMHLRLFQLQQVSQSLHLKVSIAVNVLQHEGILTSPVCRMFQLAAMHHKLTSGGQLERSAFAMV